MTEAEWLASAEPERMIGFIRSRATERQLRLFGCACCRRVFPEMDHDDSRRLVELIERYVDGHLLLDELVAAERAHSRFCYRSIPDWEYVNSADQAALTTALNDTAFIHYAASWAVQRKVRIQLRPIRAVCRKRADELPPPFVGNTPASPTALDDWARATDDCMEPVFRAEADFTGQEQLAQSHLLRDIFGNPFQPFAFDPAWRTDAVVGLARGAYEGRAFDRLPALADALEDAGCPDAAVLAHCRGPGPHVRGCWVVDLVLGKN